VAHPAGGESPIGAVLVGPHEVADPVRSHRVRAAQRGERPDGAEFAPEGVTPSDQ